jgi:3-hydroxymyristoyl/3-hydroxydecanoyl-(acyl carrier protein) dehydratase
MENIQQNQVNSAGADERAESLRFLPHGKEFRFLDEVIELTPGLSGKGTYCLKGDEVFLKGHFPGSPLMPGVLIAEAAAQLVGVIGQCDPDEKPLDSVRLTAVRGMKWKGSALPGETIVLKAEEVRRFGSFIQSKVSAEVNGVVIMQGELTLSGQTQS